MVRIELSGDDAEFLLRAIRYGMLVISSKENQEGLGDKIRSSLEGIRKQIVDQK